MQKNPFNKALVYHSKKQCSYSNEETEKNNCKGKLKKAKFGSTHYCQHHAESCNTPVL